MSDGAPAPSIGANLVWFAAIYAAVTVAVAALLAALEYGGVNVPIGAATGANIGIFMSVSALAGRRYATKSAYGWTRDDRARLSIGYVLVSFAVSLALGALVLVLITAANPASMMDFWRSPELLVIAAIAAVVLLIVGVLFYGVARLVLGRIANARPETL